MFSNVENSLNVHLIERILPYNLYKINWANPIPQNQAEPDTYHTVSRFSYPITRLYKSCMEWL
jgi:hypothetical protein